MDRSIGYLLYSNLVKLMITFIVFGEMWYGFTEASTLDEVASTINVVVIQFITVYRYKNMVNIIKIYVFFLKLYLKGKANASNLLESP